MKCEAFQYQFLIDPMSVDAELLAHKDTCHVCEQFAAESFALEQNLKQTLLIDCPDNLKQNILAQLSSQPAKNDVSFWPKLSAGVAAMLALVAVLLGANVYHLNNLEKMLLAHIDSEPQALLASNNVQSEQMNHIFKVMDLESESTLVPAAFAGNCLVKDKITAHLVYKISDDSLPITVLVVPGKKVFKQQHFYYGDYQGYIIPLENNTTMFIAAKKEQNIEGMRLHLKENLSGVI